MKEKLTVSCEGKPCYDIVLTIGFEELAGAALSVSAPERKICIVTDTNVALLYAEQVKKAFSSAFAQVEVFEFPAGEENKTLANIQTLYAFLIEHHFDRKGHARSPRRRCGRRYDRLCCSDLSARHRFYPDPDNPARPGGFKHRRKDGRRF